MRRSFLLAAALCPAALFAQAPDALHYKLEIDLDFATQTIQGTNTATRFAPQADAAARTALGAPIPAATSA